MVGRREPLILAIVIKIRDLLLLLLLLWLLLLLLLFYLSNVSILVIAIEDILIIGCIYSMHGRFHYHYYIIIIFTPHLMVAEHKAIYAEIRNLLNINPTELLELEPDRSLLPIDFDLLGSSPTENRQIFGVLL